MTLTSTRLNQLILLLGFGRAGCAEATSPYQSSLEGLWATAPAELQLDSASSITSLDLLPTVMLTLDRRFDGGPMIISGVSGSGPYGGGAHLTFRNDSLMLRYVGVQTDGLAENVAPCGHPIVYFLSLKKP